MILFYVVFQKFECFFLSLTGSHKVWPCSPAGVRHKMVNVNDKKYIFYWRRDECLFMSYIYVYLHSKCAFLWGICYILRQNLPLCERQMPLCDAQLPLCKTQLHL